MWTTHLGAAGYAPMPTPLQPDVSTLPPYEARTGQPTAWDAPARDWGTLDLVGTANTHPHGPSRRRRTCRCGSLLLFLFLGGLAFWFSLTPHNGSSPAHNLRPGDTGPDALSLLPDNLPFPFPFNRTPRDAPSTALWSFDATDSGGYRPGSSILAGATRRANPRPLHPSIPPWGSAPLEGDISRGEDGRPLVRASTIPAGNRERSRQSRQGTRHTGDNPRRTHGANNAAPLRRTNTSRPNRRSGSDAHPDSTAPRSGPSPFRWPRDTGRRLSNPTGADQGGSLFPVEGVVLLTTFVVGLLGLYRRLPSWTLLLGGGIALIATLWSSFPAAPVATSLPSSDDVRTSFRLSPTTPAGRTPRTDIATTRGNGPHPGRVADRHLSSVGLFGLYDGTSTRFISPSRGRFTPLSTPAGGLGSGLGLWSSLGTALLLLACFLGCCFPTIFLEGLDIPSTSGGGSTRPPPRRSPRLAARRRRGRTRLSTGSRSSPDLSHEVPTNRGDAPRRRGADSTAPSDPRGGLHLLHFLLRRNGDSTSRGNPPGRGGRAGLRRGLSKALTRLKHWGGTTFLGLRPWGHATALALARIVGLVAVALWRGARTLANGSAHLGGWAWTRILAWCLPDTVDRHVAWSSTYVRATAPDAVTETLFFGSVAGLRSSTRGQNVHINPHIPGTPRNIGARQPDDVHQIPGGDTQQTGADHNRCPHPTHGPPHPFPCGTGNPMPMPPAQGIDPGNDVGRETQANLSVIQAVFAGLRDQSQPVTALIEGLTAVLLAWTTTLGGVQLWAIADSPLHVGRVSPPV